MSKNLGQPGEVAFSVRTVDSVYADACQWASSALVPLDLPHSQDADGMVFEDGYESPLVAQADRIASPSTQLAQDGRTVLRIELAVPAGLDLATCDRGELRGWIGVGGDANTHHAPGQVDIVYMVDVDRRPLVIHASYLPPERHGRASSTSGQ